MKSQALVVEVFFSKKKKEEKKLVSRELKTKPTYAKFQNILKSPSCQSFTSDRRIYTRDKHQTNENEMEEPDVKRCGGITRRVILVNRETSVLVCFFPNSYLTDDHPRGGTGREDRDVRGTARSTTRKMSGGRSGEPGQVHETRCSPKRGQR